MHRSSLVLAALLVGCVGPVARLVPRSKPPILRHQMVSLDGVDLVRPAVVEAGEPFSELLVSWNVDAPENTGFRMELRVGRDDESWSPWLYVGEWGQVPATSERVTSFDGGKIDIDLFRGRELFDRAQVRMLPYADFPELRTRVVLRRLTLCFSAPGRPDLRAEDRGGLGETVIDVPVRSQREEDAEVSHRVCSPTSLGMVMAYRGVDVSTMVLAERAYDEIYDVYGNWPRAIQTAYAYGIPGYLARLSSWEEVEHFVAIGQPLIASITVERGELSGAPYAATAGHLLVVVGFDELGDVVVHDPAAPTADSVRRVYKRQELERVWLERKQGTTYVLLPPQG